MKGAESGSKDGAEIGPKFLDGKTKRQAKTIKGQDRQLTGLQKDLKGALESATLFGRERDSVLAAEEEQARKVEKLREELKEERSGGGLEARKRRELEFRKDKGKLDEEFAAGVKHLYEGRVKPGVTKVREEHVKKAKRAWGEEVESSDEEEQGLAIKVSAQILRASGPLKEPVPHRLKVVEKEAAKEKETATEKEPEPKRVRFQEAVKGPEPSNIRGKIGKPGLKRAPNKI